MILTDVECQKNPHHRDFTPIRELSENHLPKPYNRREWVDYISLLARESVRLTVRHTCPDRPTYISFAAFRGRLRHGSGTAFLCQMGKPQPCSILGCSENGGRPHLTSGIFKVVTAAHVVFGDIEAEHTEVEFFYDENDSHKKSHVVRAHGIRTSSFNLKKNRCVLECVTHDLGLFSRLQAWRNNRLKLLGQLQDIHKLSSVPAISEPGKNPPATELTVIISHPHGAPKHVSVGKLVNLTKDGHTRHVLFGGADGGTRALVGCVLRYTTATCPGSGGGTVSVLGGDQVYLAFAPHWAADGENENQSISGLGWTGRVE